MDIKTERALAVSGLINDGPKRKGLFTWKTGLFPQGIT